MVVVGLILIFLIINWSDNVIPEVDDVTFLVKKQFFSFAQVFFSNSKYSARFHI